MRITGLHPLSWLYGLLTDIRNKLYTTGIRKSHRAVQYTISVGNLTVGGTGKTPMVEYLLRYLPPTLLPPDAPVASLSRGYGRRTTGFRIANPTDTAETIGDEPMQLYRKFGAGITVCVGERRVQALQRLHAERPHVQTVLLDDAFQHRSLHPDRNLLLTDYARPFWTDHPLPAGRLRERRHGAARAGAVVVTKCPADLPPDEQTRIKAAIQRYAGPKPVFFAGLHYGKPISYITDNQAQKAMIRPVVLVSGIAHAVGLESYVRVAFGCMAHLNYGDHHTYTSADVRHILNQTPSGTAILTTEKDWVKLDSLVIGPDRARFFYLPVALYFLDREAEFLRLLVQ